MIYFTLAILLSVPSQEVLFQELATQSPVSVEVIQDEPKPTPTPKPTPQPKPVTSKWTTASVSAYSCGGIKNEAQRKMNCPNGTTAMGTVPKAGRTVACDRNLKGKTIEIEGVGQRVCEDVFGNKTYRKIDLYVSTIQEAKRWGRKNLKYRVL